VNVWMREGARCIEDRASIFGNLKAQVADG
jgi:hypothetical protein